VTLAVARDGDATAVGENRSLTGATAFDSSNISSADLSDGSASVVAIAVGLAGATDPGEAITDTGINLNSREATLRAGAKSTDDVPNATVDTDISLDGEPHSQVSIQVSGLAISNSVSGMSVTASYSSASLGDSSAEALAINFGGLPGGDISGSDGGLAAGIHLRYDFQGESNWVLGAELNLTAPNDSGASSSDTSTFGFTADAYPRTDLNINRAINVDTTALASARLRVGYAMSDYLAFVTGGLAYARYDVTSTTIGSFDGARASETATASGDSFGGVIGGGFSAFVADNATISVEGLYYTFGGDDVHFDNGMSAGLNDAFSLMTTFSIRAN
jgi:hypothetical protein